MLSEIATGLTALDGLAKTGNSLTELVRKLGKSGDTEAELRERINQMLSEILTARQALLELQENVMTLSAEKRALGERIAQLEDEGRRIADFQADRENYELKAVAANSFAYVKKTAGQPNQAAPYFCVECFDRFKRSILQLAEYDFSTDILECPTCKARVRCDHDRNRSGSVMIAPSARRSVFDV